MDGSRQALDANANESLGYPGIKLENRGLRPSYSTGSLSSRRSNNVRRGIGSFVVSLLKGEEEALRNARDNKECDMSPSIVRKLVLGPNGDRGVTAPTPKATDFNESDRSTIKENLPPANATMPASVSSATSVPEKLLGQNATIEQIFEAAPGPEVVQQRHVNFEARSDDDQNVRSKIEADAAKSQRKAFSEEKKKSVCEMSLSSGGHQLSKSEGHILISSHGKHAPSHSRPSPPNAERDAALSQNGIRVAAFVPGNRTPVLAPTPASRKIVDLKTPKYSTVGRSTKIASDVQNTARNNGMRSVSRKKPQKLAVIEDEFQKETVAGKQYLVIKSLGKGAFGEVHLVIEDESKNLYAMKKIKMSGIETAVLQECLNEIDLLVALRNSEWVVNIFAWEMDEKSKTMRIIMEYGQCDLGATIKAPSFSKLSVLQIKSMWETMLHIVAKIHEKGIVHADLKPSNFVWVGNFLKIIDFGISSRVQKDHTSVLMPNARGTLNYISPETLCPVEGKVKVGPKSDIWALGCILHLLVYGKTPFHDFPYYAKMHAISECNFKYDPLPERYVNTGVDAVLRLCLQKDPHSRPTAKELLHHTFLAV